MKIDCIILFNDRDVKDFNNSKTIKKIVKIDSPNSNVSYCSNSHGYVCNSDILVSDILKTYNIDIDRIKYIHLPNKDVLGYEKSYLRFLVEFEVDNDVMRCLKIRSLIS